MTGINKHLRMSLAANEKIRDRDKDRFPLERDFINAAILSFGEKGTGEEILREIQRLSTTMEKLMANVGWK